MTVREHCGFVAACIHEGIRQNRQSTELSRLIHHYASVILMLYCISIRADEQISAKELASVEMTTSLAGKNLRDQTGCL